MAQPRDQLGFHICLDSGQEAPSENMRHSADPTSLPVWRLRGAFICLTCHVRSNWCHNLNEEHEGMMAKSISNFFCFTCMNERIGSRLEHALSLNVKTKLLPGARGHASHWCIILQDSIHVKYSEGANALGKHNQCEIRSIFLCRYLHCPNQQNDV